MVRVDVHVEDAQPLLAQAENRQHRVVDVAKTRRACGHRVVQAAGEVEHAVRLFLEDEVGGQERARGAEPRGVPEPGEYRVITGPETEVGGDVRRPAAVRRLE